MDVLNQETPILNVLQLVGDSRDVEEEVVGTGPGLQSLPLYVPERPFNKDLIVRLLEMLWELRTVVIRLGGKFQVRLCA